jgi:hypothetical protein
VASWLSSSLRLNQCDSINFGVIVVGGGHAGCGPGCSCQDRRKTALVSLNLRLLGRVMQSGYRWDRRGHLSGSGVGEVMGQVADRPNSIPAAEPSWPAFSLPVVNPIKSNIAMR